jgi:hypothetical protein
MMCSITFDSPSLFTAQFSGLPIFCLIVSGLQYRLIVIMVPGVIARPAHHFQSAKCCLAIQCKHAK